jgi:hypothetical protein
MVERTTKVVSQAIPSGGTGYGYFGYIDGVAVYQSSKIWRYKSDAARAAKAWRNKITADNACPSQ